MTPDPNEIAPEGIADMLSTDEPATGAAPAAENTVAVPPPNPPAAQPIPTVPRAPSALAAKAAAAALQSNMAKAAPVTPPSLAAGMPPTGLSAQAAVSQGPPPPSVGRIVHFYADASVDGHAGPFAALVVAVDDEKLGLASLHVFARRHAFDQERVPPKNGNENQTRYWVWPPRV